MKKKTKSFGAVLNNLVTSLQEARDLVQVMKAVEVETREKKKRNLVESHEKKKNSSEKVRKNAVNLV